MDKKLHRCEGEHMRRKKEPKYYRIRASVFWSVVIVVIIVCIYLGWRVELCKQYFRNGRNGLGRVRNNRFTIEKYRGMIFVWKF